jgi:hypothetical protein
MGSTLNCRRIARGVPLSRLAPMTRPPFRLLAAGLLGATALGLVACGGEDAKLLPGETAREITANLDTVQQLAAEGDCVGAESAVDQVGEQIESIEGVDRKLKRALEDGAVRLEEVIATCEESSVESVAPPTSSEPFEEDEESTAPDKKEPKPKEEEKEAPAGPEKPLPPQANGKAKGHESEAEAPPVEEAEEGVDEGPSGGVGPGAAVGGEGSD